MCYDNIPKAVMVAGEARMPRLDFYVNYIHQATIRLEDSEVLIGRD